MSFETHSPSTGGGHSPNVATKDVTAWTAVALAQAGGMEWLPRITSSGS
jgi:hypothetical protein